MAAEAIDQFKGGVELGGFNFATGLFEDPLVRRAMQLRLTGEIDVTYVQYPLADQPPLLETPEHALAATATTRYALFGYRPQTSIEAAAIGQANA